MSRPSDDPDKLHILLLCDYQTNIAATVADHIQSLEALSENRFYRLSMLGDMPASLDLSRFDALIVHYTLVACSDFYLSPASRARIAAFTTGERVLSLGLTDSGVAGIWGGGSCATPELANWARTVDSWLLPPLYPLPD